MATYARRRRRSKNQLPLWSFVTAPIALFGILWIISLSNQEFQQNGDMLNTIADNSVKAEMESAYAEAEKLRADTRYGLGTCVLVPNGLVEGQFFPELTTHTQVCTVDGVTGAIDADGYVHDLARTNNIEEIRKFRGW